MNNNLIYDESYSKLFHTTGTLKQVYVVPYWLGFGHTQSSWSTDQGHIVTLPIKSINSIRLSYFKVPNVAMIFLAIIGFFMCLGVGAWLGSILSGLAERSLFLGGIGSAGFLTVGIVYLSKGKEWKKWLFGLGGVSLFFPLVIECLIRGYGNELSIVDYLIPIARFGQSSRYILGWFVGAGAIAWIAWQFLKNQSWFNSLTVLTIASSSSSIRMGVWNKEGAMLAKAHDEVIKICRWNQEINDPKELAA